MFSRSRVPALIATIICAMSPTLLATPAFQEKKDAPKQEKKQEKKPQQKFDIYSLTPDVLAELVISVYSSGAGRPLLEQIRKNGIERGKILKTLNNGTTEEISYERRFIRGASTLKDKIRLDQKTPSLEYALIFGEGKTWGVINGTVFTPREDASAEFAAGIWREIDALLRFREDGSTVKIVGKDKQLGIDLIILELADKENRSTKYYISAKTAKVLWVEYEETPPGSTTPVKYSRRFHDYRFAQGTLVPFLSNLSADGRQIEERRILTVTYGGKVDPSLFASPDATAAQPALKP